MTQSLIEKLPRNTPNLLTYGRIAAIPVIVILILAGGSGGRTLAFLLFAAAAITDYFDGMLARKMNVVSAVGVFLDPIADKLLVTAVIVALASTEQIAGWDLLPAIVILCREVLISGLREFLGGSGIKVPVTLLAKYKTSVQLIALAAVILAAKGSTLADVGLIALWIAGVLTVITGWGYLTRGLTQLEMKDK